MSRFWNEFVARLGDLTPGGVPMLAIALFVLAAIVAMLWFWWPAWLPTRWRWPTTGWRNRSRSRTGRDRLRWLRLGRLRFRWRWRWRRRKPEPAIAAELPDDQVPDLPAAVLALSADELAAAGRYAEAVRERLRAIIRELIERDVLPAGLGWTVHELARAGGRARPAAGASLAAASEVFSEIWYGLRPATADDDLAMRAHADGVRAVLDRTGDPSATGGVHPNVGAR